MDKKQLMKRISFIVNATKEDLIEDGLFLNFVTTEEDLLKFKLEQINIVLKIQEEYEEE